MAQKKPRQIAIYGKGSIGKSTIACNISVAFAEMGYQVMQVGCSPKSDSTAFLLGGELMEPTILDRFREKGMDENIFLDTVKSGYRDILCAKFPPALKQLKILVNQGMNMDLVSGLELEVQCFTALSASRQGLELPKWRKG